MTLKGVGIRVKGEFLAFAREQEYELFFLCFNNVNVIDQECRSWNSINEMCNDLHI